MFILGALIYCKRNIFEIFRLPRIFRLKLTHLTLQTINLTLIKDVDTIRKKCVTPVAHGILFKKNNHTHFLNCMTCVTVHGLHDALCMFIS